MVTQHRAQTQEKKFEVWQLGTKPFDVVCEFFQILGRLNDYIRLPQAQLLPKNSGLFLRRVAIHMLTQRKCRVGNQLHTVMIHELFQCLLAGLITHRNVGAALQHQGKQRMAPLRYFIAMHARSIPDDRYSKMDPDQGWGQPISCGMMNPRFGRHISRRDE
ncbi:hypothetical protein ACM14_24525 [Delftia sp. JD2]|nr:hypothetical protein ACM14_24525 [Delftia sp. JD2]